MGLSLVRAALKKSALGEILESATQEHLVSAIENKVQQALAPDGTLSTSIRVQMTNVLQQSNKTVREIFMGSEEAGYSAAAETTSEFLWRSIASAYGVQEQRGGRLKETDGALGGGVGSGRRHPFDFGVRVYGVM